MKFKYCARKTFDPIFEFYASKYPRVQIFVYLMGLDLAVQSREEMLSEFELLSGFVVEATSLPI